MQRQRSLLILILALIIAAITVIATIPIPLGLDLRGGSQLTIQVKPSADIPKITERELEGVKKVVEGRINGLGVSEPVIQTVGTDKILVQLPGVNDPEQAERVLGGTAQLEFRTQKPNTETQLLAYQASRAELKAKQEELRKNTDKAAIVKNQEDLQKSNQAIAELFESTKPPLEGKYLKDAYGEPTQGNNWNVAIRFDQQGGELFANLTKNLAGTGRSIGVFLDNELISAPTVGIEFAATGITGGSAVITGRFTPEQANDLGVQLRGGALPVPVEIVENRTVGASLGKQSIQDSVYASIGGLVLVLIFLMGYYLLPGVIADLALIIYALLTWASFALLGVTLTLPGVAGFILSIGMAVDANVLIFERTQEELRAGKTLYRSVESGFYRAFSSILDGNVTVAIACGALFWLGSGLVKGFALTLALGVLVSFFTAVTCTRVFMMTAITFPALRQPKFFIRNLQASTAPNQGTEEGTKTRKLSVYKTRKIWWTISGVTVLGGIIAMVISWQQIGAPLRPSLEFIGGTRLQFELDCTKPNNCDRPINLEEVREIMTAQGLSNSTIQVIDQHGLSIRTSTLNGEQRTALQTALSEKIGVFDPAKNQNDTVGPTVGRQLLTTGLLALLVSFVGIVLYISFRYKLDFAVFAIVALLHNVLVTLGIFSVLGLVLGVEVDSLFIVALLTITGFSVNDTVVIYDRIRELLDLNPNLPFHEVVDLAVNQTLTRSLNIAFIVLLTLFALLLFGGDTLRYFALAQIVGFSCGLYTSIFIASTLLVWWREHREPFNVIKNTESIDASADN